MEVEEGKTRSSSKRLTMSEKTYRQKRNEGRNKKDKKHEKLKRERFRVKHFTQKWKYLLSISPSSPSSSSSCFQGLGWSCIPTCRSQSLLLPATQLLDLVPRHAGAEEGEEEEVKVGVSSEEDRTDGKMGTKKRVRVGRQGGGR